LLLFAQRGFIGREFQGFSQWDLVLDDTNCPWDWDHIYPSAHRKWYVDAKYRDWHDTIGNKRAEGLSSNRGNGANSPKEKLANPETRKDGFITEDIWSMIQGVDANITDNSTATKLCRIILTRMTEIYEDWHTIFGIGDLNKV
jgi:hypothetical protein